MDICGRGRWSEVVASAKALSLWKNPKISSGFYIFKKFSTSARAGSSKDEHRKVPASQCKSGFHVWVGFSDLQMPPYPRPSTRSRCLPQTVKWLPKGFTSQQRQIQVSTLSKKLLLIQKGLSFQHSHILSPIFLGWLLCNFLIFRGQNTFQVRLLFHFAIWELKFREGNSHAQVHTASW